jgi:quercetin dioxygenase-like cupin family protein
VNALIVGPTEGDEVFSGEGRRVVVKGAGDELGVTESTYAPGTKGAGSHIHRRQVDAFYVLEGEIAFTGANETVRLGRGGFVAVPPNVVHSFENSSREPARFLNLFAPGVFARGLREEFAALRGVGEEPDSSVFERHDVFHGSPPPGKQTAIVSCPGEGELLTDEHRELLVKAVHPELDVLEFEIESGYEGPGPHYHERHVDSFYVLEGELEFRLADETVRAGAGTFVAVPPGVVHAFTHAVSGRTRFLNIHAPDCGFAEYMRARDRGEDVDPARYDVHDVED